MKKLSFYLLLILCILFATEARAQQDLTILSPNGGEQLIVGSDVDITWQGVPPQKLVILDYSTDNGQSWKRITDKATGLQYTWKVPNDVGSQCKLRVNLVNGTTPANWARQTSAGGVAVSVAYDTDGNIFICGNYNVPTLDFGNGISIKNSSNRPENTEIFIAKYDYNGSILWAKSLGWESRDESSSITTDSAGNIYVTGFVKGPSIDFGNGVVVDNDPITFYEDPFIVKYDKDGNTQWARQIKGRRKDIITKVVTDRKGDIIISGYSESKELDFGSGVVLTSTSIGETTFLAKYNKTGGVVWAKQTAGYCKTNSAAVDTNDNIYICGSMSGLVDFGNGIVIDEPLSSQEIFIAKYNAIGTIQWVKKSAGVKDDFAASLTVDRFNNIYVSGSFNSNMLDFGNGVNITRDIGYSAHSLFVARYTENGNIIWAQKATGDNSGMGDFVGSMATDYLGNIVIGGWFYSQKVDFGNSVILLNTIQGQSPEDDFFLVKYNQQGTAIWAKKAIGEDYDFLRSIAIDPYGSIVVCGGFYSLTLDFGNSIILKDLGALLAKYDNEIPVGTQDISDNTWSIIKPLATSLNIDMGKVLLKNSKDSLIQSFIRNIGDLPVQVKDIQITGANATEFSIVFGQPPFIIPVGEEKAVQFRFTPSATGLRSANLTITTPIDNLNQTITGEGIQPLISIAIPSIDMGIVEIGKFKDSLLSAIVKNIGSAPLTISNAAILGANSQQFEMLSSPGSFILQAGEEKNISVRFSPQAIGQVKAELQFEYNDMISGPAIAQMIGYGVGGSVFMENDSAYAGESRVLKIKLNKPNAYTLAQQQPVKFSAKVVYRNSILYADRNFAGITLSAAIAYDSLSIAGEWNGKSYEIAGIPVTATLGDRTRTDLELLNFSWLDEEGRNIEYSPKVENGTFTLLGICEEGGERLYNINGKAQMMSVSPHPANGVVKITFETIERGATRLTFTDVLGQQTVLKEGDFEKGVHSFEFDTEKFTQGIYILTMQTPTQIFTQQMVIEK